MTRRRHRSLLAVAVLGVLAINFPLLEVADSLTLAGGIGMAPFYIFGVWGLVIVLAGAVIARRG